MISLTLLLLTAVPVDCGTNLDCFLLAAKTCSPAKYSDPELDRRGVAKQAGATLLGVREYIVSHGKDGQCVLTIATRVDSYELSAVLVSQLGRAAERKRALGLQQARDTGALRQCELSPELLKATMQKEQNNEPVEWAGCKVVGCAAAIAAENGCAWSECKDGVRTLSCGEGEKTLVCAPWNSLDAPKTGPQSMLVREHLADERPCVAVCKAAKAEPVVACH